VERVEEGLLALQDTLARLVEGEPGGAVGFGDLDGAPGARRPLDEAGVRDECGGVAVALEGPGGDELASRLPDDAEVDEVCLSRFRRGEAGLLGELAEGSGERIFVSGVLAFGNGPSTEIFLRPEGSSRVEEEDLGVCVGVAVQE
jgi:hypothetical protein